MNSPDFFQGFVRPQRRNSPSLAAAVHAAMGDEAARPALLARLQHPDQKLGTFLMLSDLMVGQGPVPAQRLQACKLMMTLLPEAAPATSADAVKAAALLVCGQENHELQQMGLAVLELALTYDKSHAASVLAVVRQGSRPRDTAASQVGTLQLLSLIAQEAPRAMTTYYTRQYVEGGLQSPQQVVRHAALDTTLSLANKAPHAVTGSLCAKLKEGGMAAPTQEERMLALRLHHVADNAMQREKFKAEAPTAWAPPRY